MTRLLLVEDDSKLADMLTRYLADRDFAVTVAATLAEARRIVTLGGIEIIALDLTLPDGDGLDFCRELRAGVKTPVVMITARGDEMDRIVGLEIGADDYIPKPFNPRELVARLKAVLRRSVVIPPSRKDLHRFGDVEIDISAMTVTKKGKVVLLTAHQFALLHILAERAGRIQSREQLMDGVKGEELDAFDRSIDVHISRIRAALEDDPKHPVLIKTVRGAGYLLTPLPPPPDRDTL
jgi:DNA-binding response OmpR family regulator